MIKEYFSKSSEYAVEKLEKRRAAMHWNGARFENPPTEIRHKVDGKFTKVTKLLWQS